MLPLVRLSLLGSGPVRFSNSHWVRYGVLGLAEVVWGEVACGYLLQLARFPISHAVECRVVRLGWVTWASVAQGFLSSGTVRYGLLRHGEVPQ